LSVLIDLISKFQVFRNLSFSNRHRLLS